MPDHRIATVTPVAERERRQAGLGRDATCTILNTHGDNYYAALDLVRKQTSLEPTMNPFRQQAVSMNLPNIDGYDPGVAVPPNRHPASVVPVSGLKWPISTRIGSFRAVVVLGLVLSATPALQAEHARIDLRVSGEGKEVIATADQEPPAGGRNNPPVLKVHVNKPLVLQFILTNTYPHTVIEHVNVLYYVVRVDKLGRKAAPSFSERNGPDKNTQPILEPGVVTKGKFVADFKPDCRVGTRLKFQITEPGLYTARVETLGTQSDHEHFSAIDLVAE